MTHKFWGMRYEGRFIIERKQGCFIGHRDSVGMEDQIDTALKKRMEQGVTAFLSGGMGNFDKTCEKIAKDLGAYLYYIPYHRSRIKDEDYDWYDVIHCPFPNRPYRKADIPKRNEWLVDNSNVCLCHVSRPGGAKRTLDYAIRGQKEIILLKSKKVEFLFGRCFPFLFHPTDKIKKKG